MPDRQQLDQERDPLHSHRLPSRLFAGSHTAGQRIAAIMNLPATAKANGLEPHAWLVDPLTRPPAKLDLDIDTLLTLP